jgi:hypothetical protein
MVYDLRNRMTRELNKLRLHPRISIVLAALVISAMLLYAFGRKRAAQRPGVQWFVQQYLGLTVALGERDRDSLDFYFGPEGPVSQMRRQPPKQALIAQQAADLRDRLERDDASWTSPTDRRRATFLRFQLDAMRLRAKMLLGETYPFDEEGHILFGVRAGADTNAEARAQTRREIGHLIGDAKNPARAYSVYERQFFVEPDRVPAVMNAALQACRSATLEHIELPAEEHIEVEYVFHKPWSGFSRYLGHSHSVIQINMDFPHTVDQILDLACHEGYPGHHVFNTLRDRSLVERDQEEEWLAQPTFSPQSFVSEAAASYAPEIAFTPEQRIHVERDVLFPLAGLDASKAARNVQVERLIDSLDTAEPAIARDYLDGRLEFVRAADALERETLMEHAETMLLYVNEYRSYMLAYTVGRGMVQKMVERDDPSPAVRWSRYVSLMKQPVYSLDSF